MTALLPPPPRPPHDPYRLPLDARSGFRQAFAEHVELSPAGALVLAPAPGSGRRLDEASGSFGGLTPPRNVAVAADGSVFLLDAKSGRLKRFDACACRFDIAPCLGGAGDAPRRVREPGGIGIRGGDLFVADSGNGRVQVFSLQGFVLRAILAPPAVAQPFRPEAVAFDGRGRLLVADPNNAAVHVFDATGRYLRAISGVGAARALATDCDDRLYVFSGEGNGVAVFDLTTGTLLETRTRAAEVASRFPRLPFVVSPEGALVLACAREDAPAAFGPGGEPLASADAGDPLFEPAGTFVTQAIDSALYRCQWDRVEFELALPERTRVEVFTHTAETELGASEILALADDGWETSQVFAGGQAPARECLVLSPGGRYLWLKLVLRGDGTRTPSVRRVVLDFPRISLRRYLPAVFGEEPHSADFTDRLLAVFDRGFREIEAQLDELPGLFDPLSAPAGGRSDFLGFIASWIGVTLDRKLPLAERRRFLKQAGELAKLRGTLPGLRRTLHAHLGLAPARATGLGDCAPCTTPSPPAFQPPDLVLEHFKLRRWLLLGSGRLGDAAVLWGQNIVNRSQLGGPSENGSARLGSSQLITTQDPFRDPFHVYAHRFSVFVPGWIGRSPERRKSLERLIGSEKPANTAHQLVFVEPRFRIGVQSMIGFDAVVGRYPQGVELGAAPLGKGTILNGGPSGTPHLSVGRDARVGTTTRLA